MDPVAVVAVGLGVGFVSGLFGKGGSAIATPLLHAIGVPAIVAVASPLPATFPSTLAAYSAYWSHHLVYGRVFRWTVAIGVPSTVLGALATRWIDGHALVLATDVILIVLGIRFLFSTPSPARMRSEPSRSRLRLSAVALVVGFLSGLLANSGGFLLVPLYLVVIRLPIKEALASSLAVAAVLALPSTITHAALGHIDWGLVAVFALASTPLSYVGARVALRTDSSRLERLYGLMLAVGGTFFLTFGR